MMAQADATRTVMMIMRMPSERSLMRGVQAAAVLMAIVMVVLIAFLFWAEDLFGKDVEG